ncbi:MAG: GNAT family acetyltransferase [Verrucomicrobiales bacterium]|nr:GNAT family acetyltransferase [Verrucomicrobiales bacterium]
MCIGGHPWLTSARNQPMTAQDFIIRPYRPADREAVRRICCDTGFLGRPVDEIFQDRELFADFLTAYYTDEEPESAVVLEVDGAVQGYILGSRLPARQSAYNLRAGLRRALTLLWRLVFVYNRNSRRYVWWLLTRGRKETPLTPRRMAHFHINMYPGAKNVRRTRALLDYFFAYLTASGEPAVYGQMVVSESRRGAQMFARYGFALRDQVEVTKYRRYTATPIFLFTVVKDLTVSGTVYGHDLRKKLAADRAGR